VQLRPPAAGAERLGRAGRLTMPRLPRPTAGAAALAVGLAAVLAVGLAAAALVVGVLLMRRPRPRAPGGP
jgi:hypothetical protein